MARSVWSGSISFGLVNVPVKAYTAQRDHGVHFHQLEKGSGARIRYHKVSEKTGEEVEADDIELGYETSRGHYVTVERDELDELRPTSTRTIDIGDFVPLDEIDPVFYDRTYWLAPDGNEAERAYRLLQAAMEDKRKVGVGTVVMRDKQYLAAVRPYDGALAMSTMRFADEVVARDDIDGVPAGGDKPPAKELRLATQIVESLTTGWDPERYHDTYTEQLRDLIEHRRPQEAAGAEPEETAEVVDLMAALEKSLAAAKDAKDGQGKGQTAGGAKRRGATKGGSRRSA